MSGHGGHGTRPLEEGLVLDLRFSEGSGDPKDYSGNRNHGVLTNGITWTTVDGEQAILDDGANEYVSVAEHASLHIGEAGGDATWLVEFISDGVTGTSRIPWIWGQGANIGMKCYLADTEPGRLRLDFYYTGGGAWYGSSLIDVAAGERVVFLAVLSGASMKLFVNGVLGNENDSLSDDLKVFATRIEVGCSYNLGINGKIFRKMAWSRALSDEEVALISDQRRRM